jgi:hypothetical protein
MFRLMLVLMVATLSSYPIPTILLNQLNDVSDLHGATVIPVSKTVNVSPFNWILRPAEYSIAATLRNQLRFGTNRDLLEANAETV